MQFFKIAILSLIVLATALPNALPEPEANQLEARTFTWLYKDKKCDCNCEEGNKGYKRDEGNLEVRTLSWLLPLLSKDQCPKKCKKKCEDYYEEEEKKCKKYAEEKYKWCKKECKKPHYKRTEDYCEEECKKEFYKKLEWCEGKWGY